MATFLAFRVRTLAFLDIERERESSRFSLSTTQPCGFFEGFQRNPVQQQNIFERLGVLATYLL
jgi:hypothetical protein